MDNLPDEIKIMMIAKYRLEIEAKERIQKNNE